jgi:L-lactate dehydrogenase complex protein LldE
MSAPASIRAYPPKPSEAYVFGTCLMDLFYPQAGLAAVELMEREGVRVIFPPDQTCCGQPAFNSGYRDEARRVARAQLALFPKPIPVVVPSGSCGAMLARHYPELFAGEPDEARARDFAARVFEWSDFMVNVLRVRLRGRGAPCAVTYHPSCHLLRELGPLGNGAQAPQTLLAQLEGVELRPLPDAEVCCGFGGTFAIKQAAISEAMVVDKCRAVAESGAQVLVSVDCGCLLNIGGALERSGKPTAAGTPVRVLPLPQFVKERIDGA